MQTLNGYKLTQDDVHLDDVHIKCAGSAGIIGSLNSGYIDGFTLTRSIISGAADTPTDNLQNENWGARVYNMRDGLVEDTEFRNIEKEHGWYMSRAGDFRFQRCWFHDIGSQGIQDAQREMDLIGGRADNVQCLLEILQCKFERCATPLGRRPSWNVSIFAFDENIRNPDGSLWLDPVTGKPKKGHMVRSNTDVVISGCQFSGSGYEHTASGGRDCNSTGGILVQDRNYFDLRRSTFNYVRPDREVIQIKNVANAFVGPIELNGGHIVLEHMDHCTVNIKPGTGNGEIRRRVLGAHTAQKISTIQAGYSH